MAAIKCENDVFKNILKYVNYSFIIFMSCSYLTRFPLNILKKQMKRLYA